MDDLLETASNSLDTTKMVIIAGFFGGILSVGFVGDMSWKQRVFAVLSGMIMAHYLSPLIAFLFKEADYQETIGFLVGLFGMSICSALFRAIQASDLWALLQKRFSVAKEDV